MLIVVETVLSLENVSFAYGQEPILQDLNVSIAAGTFVALVGPNGSGKSTLVKVALGLLPPSSGLVSLFGMPSNDPLARSRIGYVPQRPFLAGKSRPRCAKSLRPAGSVVSGGEGLLVTESTTRWPSSR